MSAFWIVLLAGLCFLAAYLTYGRFLGRFMDLNADRKTPACEVNDGVDYVPTPKGFLLGQHFSAIAAAGPIVGPVLAGVWFGWGPVLIWLVVGAIFFGAVHDFSSMVGSVRHKAKSVVEMAHIFFGRRGYLLFLAFVWISLIYVIIAFTDLTSSSFTAPELGGGVASSSMLYLFLGLVMGICLRVFKMSVKLATLIFLPLVCLAIWYGKSIPLFFPSVFGLTPAQLWNYALLFYCFAASIIPVWLLLQPRGYLGGFFLYAVLAAGLAGLFLGGEKIVYPAFTGFTNTNGLPLFPLLFVTVACGACSGFHGIVCSGTTSKQIEKETDCRAVGYGGMLLEGLVAVLALSTVMILAKGNPLLGLGPDRIYAEGLSVFVQHLGIPRDFARSFTLLAFTTFIYDTLDVATRLARHIFQELTGWKGRRGVVMATLASLVIPFLCVSLKVTDAAGNLIPVWKVFWTLFGTSNQLLAALTLMMLSVWLYKSGKPWWISVVPMVFMMIMTLWSLALMIRPFMIQLMQGHIVFDAVLITALLLCALALLLIKEAVSAVFDPSRSDSTV